MSAVQPSSSPVIFTAKWNLENLHLKPKEESLCTRVWKAVKAFFSKIFNALYRTITHRLVLPAAYYPKIAKAYIQAKWSDRWFGSVTKSNEQVRKNYTAIPLYLKTPKGNTISGAFYQAKAGQGKDIPTILCFNGNGSLFKRGSGEWLMNLADECPLPFNVVAFDYPSCGESRGPIREEEIVLASDTIFQCVRDHFHISEGNIHSFGVSLGGGASAQFLKMHPKTGNYVNSHSFKCLSKMPSETGMVEKYFYPLVPKCIKSCLTLETCKKVASTCISKFFGEMDSIEALKMIKNRTLLIFHPHDPLIGEGNLAKTINPKEFPNVEIVQLTDHPEKVETRIGYDHHNSPLCNYLDHHGLSADKRALNFLLGKEVFKAALPQKIAR